MSKVLLATLTRADSSRLPNKCLFELAGKPAMVHGIERVLDVYPNPDYVAIATPTEVVNDPIERIAKQFGYDVVRNPQHSAHEQVGLMDHYGLGRDDFLIWAATDATFAYVKYIPSVLEKLREHGLDRMAPVIGAGTMAAAASFVRVWRAGSLAEENQHHTNWWKPGGTNFTREKSLGKHLLLDLPDYLNEPWPWAAQHLDWPLQALSLRAIYKELYRGKPIDIRDVGKLLEKDTLLANLVPRDALIANQPVFPDGVWGMWESTIVNTCDYRRFKFEEGGEGEIGRCVE